MARIPLEDSFIDVVAKAKRGLGLSDEEVAARAGITSEQWSQFKDGKFDAGLARRLAVPLTLNPEALIELGENTWRPAEVDIPGLACCTTPYQDMMVNAYLVWEAKSRLAIIFDTGTSAAGLLDLVKQENLEVKHIFLTHTHADHVADLAKLKTATGAPAYAGEKEPFAAASTLAGGDVFHVGNLKIEARSTSGHARGGITYVVAGLARRLAVVGDAIFSASMGGGVVSYEEALRTNRKEIFSLPDDTVLCPGHGPLTTVGEEKKHNPFFPEFKK